MSVEQESADCQEENIELKQDDDVVELDTTEQAVVAEKLTYEELANELACADAKAKENWDKALRIQAEMENLKKRTQKDIENAHKFALDNFARELLAVVDSLEIGIQTIIGEDSEIIKLKEGSELTLKQLQSAFAKFNINAIDPVGQIFNPEQHQAMSMQESAEVAPNSVITVFQKGYQLNGRVIRPAMVVVSKAPLKTV